MKLVNRVIWEKLYLCFIFANPQFYLCFFTLGEACQIYATALGEARQIHALFLPCEREYRQLHNYALFVMIGALSPSVGTHWSEWIK